MNNVITIPRHSADLLNRQTLQSLSVEVFGHRYRARNDSEEDPDAIFYYPESESIILYNSFLPVIRVEARIEATGLCLLLKKQFRKSVRVGLYIFFALILLFQIALVSWALGKSLVDIFPMFIPSIIAVFLFALSFISAHISFIIFNKRYRMQIEEIIS